MDRCALLAMESSFIVLAVNATVVPRPNLTFSDVVAMKRKRKRNDLVLRFSSGIQSNEKTPICVGVFSVSERNDAFVVEGIVTARRVRSKEFLRCQSLNWSFRCMS